MKIELRPACDEDKDFLTRLYEETRAAEIALVPWTDEQKRAFIDHQFKAQDDHYRSHFPHASFDVIAFDGERAGRLYVFRDGEQIRILDISITEGFPFGDIGGELIRRLKKEASESGRPLRIYLDVDDPQLPIFADWGFSTITADDGFRRLYEWRP